MNGLPKFYNNMLIFVAINNLIKFNVYEKF